jgi:hypothetical protein
VNQTRSACAAQLNGLMGGNLQQAQRLYPISPTDACARGGSVKEQLHR